MTGNETGSDCSFLRLPRDAARLLQAHHASSHGSLTVVSSPLLKVRRHSFVSKTFGCHIFLGALLRLTSDMAEEESAQQLDGSASPQSSSHQATLTGSKAAKDRSCPFCGQAFTSSSLGRHLDLYIKPKNPKPADGVHDVAEIRKIRGGITRRQPRSNFAYKKMASENQGGAPGSSEAGTPSFAVKHPDSVDMRNGEGSWGGSPLSYRDNDSAPVSLNKANWQATGVINNIPPRVPSRTNDATPTGQAQRINDMRRDTTGNRVQRPEYESESMWKLQEAAEVGKAAELALREVLSSLDAASKRVEPKQLFEDVDFLSLSFPGLCLAILPAPTTLFSPTPFSTADSWTLHPPGQRQFEAINRRVNEQVAVKRSGVTENFKDSQIFRHSAHVQGAWEHWQCMPETDKATAWQLELCRAYSKATDSKYALKEELEGAQTRIRHLEAEYDRLSRCQLPREYLMHPPNTTPAAAAIMKEMKNVHQKTEAAGAAYDADALLSKWRTTVKATSRRPAAQPSYASGTTIYNDVEPRQDQLKADMFMNGAIFGVNGPMPRDSRIPAVASSGVEYETPPKPGAIIDDENEEDADADGDEYDDVQAGTDSTALIRSRYAAEKDNARQSPADNTGPLNTNGKRPLGPIITHGRGVKMYRSNANDNTEMYSR
ncbi:Hypothetical protein R9X50_00137600 [Acrodontium crateriforme]|uniref:Uncharacterized protein n=1 Tax=Acrodontium crateriforme TaxID=150365 RepID=A0AAQ3LZD4_9PEZI|nr:Hypothetical protein R9X50_00137600 [Acrodontium crateriforme]